MNQLFGMVVAIVLLTVPGRGMADDTGLEVTNPREVPVLVDVPSSTALSVGLTQEKVRSLVDARFASYGISTTSTSGPGQYYVYVHYTVLSRSHSFSVEMVRLVSYDCPKGTCRSKGSTHLKGGVGIHSGDGSYILISIDSGLQSFVIDFVNANRSRMVPPQQERSKETPQ